MSLVCPCCRAVLGVEVLSGPDAEGGRWLPLRMASKKTGEPVSRLRRWVKAGRLDARKGPRGAYLVRANDIEALKESLPKVCAPHIERDEILAYLKETG